MEGLPPPLAKVFRYVDRHREEHINSLRTAVTYASVSCRTEAWPEVTRMLEWTADRIRKAGGLTEMVAVNVKGFTDKNCRPLQLPNLLLATISKGKKRVILVYAHVDVVPGVERDKPGIGGIAYSLTESDDGKVLEGRGALDCKGPLVCWLDAIDAYQKMKLELPVNIKFVVNGTHEIGSPGIQDILWQRRNTFLKDVNVVCVSDSTWLRENMPCVVYGLRGLCYFHVEVSGPSRVLHSGDYGGVVQEPLRDLIFLLNSLQTPTGDIDVPGIDDGLLAITADEERDYENLLADVDNWRSAIGAKKLRHSESPSVLLMHRWRLPSLSYHGIENAMDGPELHTNIPGKVVGKFSVRLAPNQEPDKVAMAVKEKLDNVWRLRYSPNEMKLTTTAKVKPWLVSPWSPAFCAARRAIKHVYRVEGDLVRDGCTMDVVLMLSKTCTKNVVVLPIAGQFGGGAHAESERITARNFLSGIKLMAAYMYEIAILKKV